MVDFAAVSVGYIVSITVKPNLAQLAGVVTIIINLMLSGIRPTLADVQKMAFPMSILPNFSLLRWATEAVYTTEIDTYVGIYDISQGIEYFGYNLNNFKLDMAMLVVLGLVFRLIAFLLLLLLDRDKKK